MVIFLYDFNGEIGNQGSQSPKGSKEWGNGSTYHSHRQRNFHERIARLILNNDTRNVSFPDKFFHLPDQFLTTYSERFHNELNFEVSKM